MTKLYRTTTCAALIALSVVLSACSDDGDTSDNSAADEQSSLTCADGQWADYDADQCRSCPPAETGCFMFDYFANNQGDYDSIFDPQTDVLRWDVKPGTIQIVEATLRGKVRSGGQDGQPFSVSAEIDGDTMRFDLSEVPAADKNLRVTGFNFTEGCGQSFAIPQDFLLDPDGDQTQNHFGCNPMPAVPAIRTD